MGNILTWYHILMCFMVARTVEFGEHGLDNLESMHGRWNFVRNSKKSTWVHMKDFHFYIIMKQVPFDLDKYFLRFDRKCVLHNQDEKLVSCGLKNWEKFVKIGFTRESLSKSHFSKLLQVLLIFTNLFERKIFVGKQNSWIWFQSSDFSSTRSNFHYNSSSLDLQSSNVKMRLER